MCLLTIVELVALLTFICPSRGLGAGDEISCHCFDRDNSPQSFEISHHIDYDGSLLPVLEMTVMYFVCQQMTVEHMVTINGDDVSLSRGASGAGDDALKAIACHRKCEKDTGTTGSEKVASMCADRFKILTRGLQKDGYKPLKSIGDSKGPVYTVVPNYVAEANLVLFKDTLKSYHKTILSVGIDDWNTELLKPFERSLTPPTETTSCTCYKPVLYSMISPEVGAIVYHFYYCLEKQISTVHITYGDTIEGDEISTNACDRYCWKENAAKHTKDLCNTKLDFLARIQNAAAATEGKSDSQKSVAVPGFIRPDKFSAFETMLTNSKSEWQRWADGREMDTSPYQAAAALDLLDVYYYHAEVEAAKEELALKRLRRERARASLPRRKRAKHQYHY